MNDPNPASSTHPKQSKEAPGTDFNLPKNSEQVEDASTCIGKERRAKISFIERKDPDFQGTVSSKSVLAEMCKYE